MRPTHSGKSDHGKQGASPPGPAQPALLPCSGADQPALPVRISSHSSGEPYFGKWNTNRFDDPSADPTARYGTCYLGSSLAVAVAETLLHDRKAIKGRFVVEPSVIRARYVVRFGGEPLVLANLTGIALKRLGGHAGLTGTSSYATPKRWSAAIHAHPDKVDGFVYMSRHLNDEQAIVLFDRSRHKLHMLSATPLHQHPDFGQVATDLAIGAAA